jgi:ribonuclease R
LLDIADSEREMFQRRLGAMEREGQLMRNRKGAYILPERASLTRAGAGASGWLRLSDSR